MREPLVEAGLIVGAVGTGIATLRFLLLAAVVVWSLRADNAGRAHARAIVRLLRTRAADHPQRQE